jgi:hypothetical protein
MRRALALALFLVAAPAGALEHNSLRLLAQAWPDVRATRVDEIGRGVAVVFSPDLSVKDNCLFYEALGFACYQDADWMRVLDRIHRHNLLYPEGRISTIVLETHGTNGNGLKLQESYAPTAERSYIAVGALQERLEPDGIYNVIISACNSGRLLRPYIYDQLDPKNGDRLFLPATCGIVDATPEYESRNSAVTIITPESSHIETTLVGTIAELAPATRRALQASAARLHIRLPKEFAVSDIMSQILTRDPRLELAANHPVEDLSRTTQDEAKSERLFRKFLTYLNAVAAREGAPKKPPQKAAAARKKKAGATR